jgi:hypothetical protein
MTREEKIDQLSKAIAYYINNPPRLLTRAAIAQIANRFAVHPKSLEEAICIYERLRGH